MRSLAGNAAWLAMVGAFGLGVALGASAGSRIGDADAAKKHQPTTLWAVVDASGNLVRGQGAFDSFRGSTGHYAVDFTRDVSACAYAATTSDGYAGDTGVAAGAIPSYVDVYTNAGQAQVDLPFHLIVTC